MCYDEAGGLVVAGDSTVSLMSVALNVTLNSASKHGGGILLNGSKAEGVFRIRELHLIDNNANGVGGGLWSSQNIILLPGGLTKVTGNSASCGAAAALSNAALLMQVNVCL